MKSKYLGNTSTQFMDNFLESLLEFYGNLEYKKFTRSVEIELPFSDLWLAFGYSDTEIVIAEKGIAEITNNTAKFFKKSNTDTVFNLLLLKENSISLLQGDSSINYGGQSFYSIINTDKGLVFFSSSQNPSRIRESKSVCIESGKDLTPVTFGNQVLSSNNEVLKQPFRLTDEDGEIYTALDIYNISYKPEDFTALPKSFISNWGLASKDNPQEAIMTSLLIYDEEEE